MTNTRPERGMVTVELALGLIALALSTGAAIWLVLVMAVQIHCADTAAAVARQAARGDAAGVRRAEAEKPAGSTVSMERTGHTVTVTVRVGARPLGGGFPAVPLTAKATVAVEDQ